MLIDTSARRGWTRRWVFALPVALGGLWARYYLQDEALPDPETGGTGPAVTLALFGRDGGCLGVRKLRKVVVPDRVWREKLSSEAYQITRRGGTEFAFANRYWHERKAGLYRCVCCGTALFRSEAKFDSGTGWPSFTGVVAESNVTTRADGSQGLQRTEVLCAKCDAHLGHVFEDGPAPTGLRYCMNSAALRLIPYAS